MNLNQKIDTYLKAVSNLDSFYPPSIYDKVFNDLDNSRREYNLIFSSLERHDVIEPLKPGSNLYCISPLGNEIIEKGGWLKYVEILENIEIERLDKERLETDLAKSNIEANKLNKRNSNFNIWFTIINVIIGIINLIAAFAN